MNTDLWVDIDTLRTAIQAEYDEVAAHPDKGFHFHVGRAAATRLGYPADRIETTPEAVIESFAGVGNPFSWGEAPNGATVVDLGSGAGFDSLLAAQMVGPEGRVIGVDMTPAMVNKARDNAQLMNQSHVHFRLGLLEDLPVDDGSVDLVISNGVLNLAPDKEAAFAEAFRVLKPGGTLQISDIVLSRPVPPDGKANIDLWTG